MSACIMQGTFLFCRFVDEETINFLGRWVPEKFMSLRTFLWLLAILSGNGQSTWLGGSLRKGVDWTFHFAVFSCCGVGVPLLCVLYLLCYIWFFVLCLETYCMMVYDIDSFI